MNENEEEKRDTAVMPGMRPARLVTIEVHKIDEHPRNARSHYDEAALQELEKSIAASGLQSPIVVTNPNRQGRYTLESGHRRLRAVKNLGWRYIQALVRDQGKDLDVEVSSLAENLQRQNLTLYETAKALTDIADRHKLSSGAAASLVGLSQGYVANLQRIYRGLCPAALAQWSQQNPRCNMAFLSKLASAPKDQQMEAFTEDSEAPAAKAGEPKPRHNHRAAAETLITAILKMPKAAVDKLNARQCVEYIMGSRAKLPEGIAASAKPKNK